MKPMHRTHAARLMLSTLLLSFAGCATTQFVPAPPPRVPVLPAEALPEATPEPIWCRGDCLTALRQRLQTRRETLQTLRSTLGASAPVAASAAAITGH